MVVMFVIFDFVDCLCVGGLVVVVFGVGLSVLVLMMFGVV